ncbi:MAG: LPS export ABC transporter permease LptG [Alphaproteobacteria bacterium]|nr:LPS export ABC transporter permease LptG [Alphaproteobacteria bacterium]
MRLSPIFARYMGRQYLQWFLGVILVMATMIVLFDLMELIRRTASKPDATFDIVVTMSLLRLPDLLQRTFPFAILFAAILAFWRFNRNHELVVARAAGVSAWQFMLPVLGLAFAIGVLALAVFNPFAAAMLQRFEFLESRYISGKSSFADLSETGLWLRQSTDTGHYIIHAPEIAQNAIELRRVIVFVFEGQDRFAMRIDAGAARLERGSWLLADARLARPGGQPQRVAEHRIPTDLTPENFSDSFAPPQTLSFWSLPGFIDVLEKAGFPALRHKVYWNMRLVDPILFCGMILLAATMSLRPTRRGGTSMLVVGGILIGFAIFVVSDVVFALGASARVPVELAAWAPATIACLLGAAAVFHLEDG